jgi:hypothetical protein
MSLVVDPIQNVNTSGITVYKNGVIAVPVADYSILTTSQYGTNYAVHFVIAPSIGTVISADFSYKFLCSFDTDTLPLSKIMSLNGAGLWECGSVRFSSVLQ